MSGSSIKEEIQISDQRIPIWPEGIPDHIAEADQEPHLIPYLSADHNMSSPASQRATVIVCPGGGYKHLANHEGEPVARWLNELGIHAFVLKYRVHPYRHPNPLKDAQRAIRIVRSRAEEWGVDPGRVGILGFSAGGHLAASAGIHFNLLPAEAEDPYREISARPDLMIVCYSVISFVEHYHKGSRVHLLGDDAPDDLVRLLSLETQVGPNTPPAFIWHATDDPAVPVENSLMLASALSRHGVPFDLHTFESGQRKHGLGLATEHPEAHQWTNLCALWLKKHEFVE